MTNRFEDNHTRAGILRGGTFFLPYNTSRPVYNQNSIWYFPNRATLDTHGKLLLMDDGYDRAATVGFRCVQQLPIPPCAARACIRLNPPAAVANLTAAGAIDWRHFGGPPASKRAGSGGISSIRIVGTTTAAVDYDNNPTGFVWSDGAGTARQSVPSTTGTSLASPGGSFLIRLQLPPDATTATAILYVGTWFTAGLLTLSSAADGTNLTDMTVQGAGYRTVAYEIRFSVPWLDVLWSQHPQRLSFLQAELGMVQNNMRFGMADLTAEGTADWIHWGSNGRVTATRKAGANILDGKFKILGSGQVKVRKDSVIGFQWSDASQGGNMTSSTYTGLSLMGGAGTGFELVIPASTGISRCRVYLGVWSGYLRLSAHLDDNSGHEFVDDHIGSFWARNLAYDFTFSSATNGTRLIIRWELLRGYSVDGVDPHAEPLLQAVTLQRLAPTGHISLQAATLS